MTDGLTQPVFSSGTSHRRPPRQNKAPDPVQHANIASPNTNQHESVRIRALSAAAVGAEPVPQKNRLRAPTTGGEWACATTCCGPRSGPYLHKCWAGLSGKGPGAAGACCVTVWRRRRSDTRFRVRKRHPPVIPTHTALCHALLKGRRW